MAILKRAFQGLMWIGYFLFILVFGGPLSYMMMLLMLAYVATPIAAVSVWLQENHRQEALTSGMDSVLDPVAHVLLSPPAFLVWEGLWIIGCFTIGIYLARYEFRPR